MRVKEAEVRQHFDAYVDGELRGDDLVAFEDAVERDARLRRDLEDFTSAIRLVREMPEVTAPPRFLQLVQQRIRRRTRGRYYHYKPKSLVTEAAVCAVLVFILAALYLFAIPPVKAPEPDVAAGYIERVHLAPVDARYLSQFGRIDVVGTSLTGNDLEVYMTVSPERLPELRDALRKSDRLELVPVTVYKAGAVYRLKIRAPAGPVSSPVLQE